MTVPQAPHTCPLLRALSAKVSLQGNLCILVCVRVVLDQSHIGSKSLTLHSVCLAEKKCILRMWMCMGYVGFDTQGWWLGQAKAFLKATLNNFLFPGCESSDKRLLF